MAKLTLATHLGTPVDAPYHFDPDGETLENMPLERYMGPALLLDLRRVAKNRTPISVDDFPVHRLLLGQGIPIIENLINLDQLVGHPFELWALPIKLKGGDGGAARAVARLI